MFVVLVLRGAPREIFSGALASGLSQQISANPETGQRMLSSLDKKLFSLFQIEVLRQRMLEISQHTLKPRKPHRAALRFFATCAVCGAVRDLIVRNLQLSAV